jgi:hypothetical protein
LAIKQDAFSDFLDYIMFVSLTAVTMVILPRFFKPIFQSIAITIKSYGESAAPEMLV